MKTKEEFWNEISNNKELTERLTKIENKQELEVFFKENEIEGTLEEFRKFIAEKTNAALTDEELEAVAGGGLILRPICE